MAPTVIIPKEKEKKTEGEDEPPAKRGKVTVKKGSVATHSIQFVDVSITIAGDDYHTETVYVYKLPYLVDPESDTAKAVVNEQFYRELVNRNLEKKPKRDATSRRAGGFMTR